MEFVYDGGTQSKAFIQVGKPYEYYEGLDWVCPYEISTEKLEKIFGLVGIDSLQALELIMKTLSVEIEYWENTRKVGFSC